jgi:hypothetical protein
LISTLNNSPPIIAHQLAANGSIPNHPRWPQLVYPGVGAIAAADAATFFLGNCSTKTMGRRRGAAASTVSITFTAMRTKALSV